MNDLIGLPQAASILGISRQMAHLLYKSGKLMAISVVGSSARPRPLFLRSYVEEVARRRAVSAPR